MTQQQAQATPEVVTGTLPISNSSARILIDPGATHSFVATSCIMHLGKEPKQLDNPMNVSTPVGENPRIDAVYLNCIVKVQGNELLVDLLPLEMVDFDVILGMDWLAKHNSIVDCFSKTVIFKKSRDLEFCFQGERKILPSCIISAMTAKRCLQKGYPAYLDYVINKDIQEAKLDTILVVMEFPEVFPEKLVGLPPDRELEFTIDLIPGSAPTSQALYRMAPSKLKELKVQLQDLVDRRFIRPSVSPWGAPVLFMKKKKWIFAIMC